jgi:hypothetical protein
MADRLDLPPHRRVFSYSYGDPTDPDSVCVFLGWPYGRLGSRGRRMCPSSRPNTTLNDGYLGLVIDEGRSEVRQVS